MPDLRMATGSCGGPTGEPASRAMLAAGGAGPVSQGGGSLCAQSPLQRRRHAPFTRAVALWVTCARVAESGAVSCALLGPGLARTDPCSPHLCCFATCLSLRLCHRHPALATGRTLISPPGSVVVLGATSRLASRMPPLGWHLCPAIVCSVPVDENGSAHVSPWGVNRPQ